MNQELWHSCRTNRSKGHSCPAYRCDSRLDFCYFCSVFKSRIMLEYFHNVPFSVTVCDKDGKILEMNETAERVLSHGKHIIGQNLLDCHPEPARTKLTEMLKNHNLNTYTIEKNGVKKLVYQSPWFENGEFAGYIELSMELPAEMPHFVRQPKN